MHRMPKFTLTQINCQISGFDEGDRTQKKVTYDVLFPAIIPNHDFAFDAKTGGDALRAIVTKIITYDYNIIIKEALGLAKIIKVDAVQKGCRKLAETISVSEEEFFEIEKALGKILAPYVLDRNLLGFMENSFSSLHKLGLYAKPSIAYTTPFVNDVYSNIEVKEEITPLGKIKKIVKIGDAELLVQSLKENVGLNFILTSEKKAKKEPTPN